MIGLIICTHSSMADGVREAAEMIIGEQESLQSIGFFNGDSTEDLTDRLKTAGKAYKSKGVPYCFLVDLPGATPFNCSLVAGSEDNIPVVTGVNLPLVIELLLNSDEFNKVTMNLEAYLKGKVSSVTSLMQVYTLSSLS